MGAESAKLRKLKGEEMKPLSSPQTKSQNSTKMLLPQTVKNRSFLVIRASRGLENGEADLQPEVLRDLRDASVSRYARSPSLFVWIQDPLFNTAKSAHGPSEVEGVACPVGFRT